MTPATSPIYIEETDGAYGVFTRFADQANGASETVKWYYGSGAIDSLTYIAQTISEQQSTPSDNSTKEKVNNVITNIVNNAIKPNVPTTSMTQSTSQTQNGFERRVVSTLVNAGSDKTLGNAATSLDSVIRNTDPTVNNTVTDSRVTLVGQTGGEGEITHLTMEQILAKSHGSELRVALSPDSFVELVNGGVTLPTGVSQEFYVVKDKL